MTIKYRHWRRNLPSGGYAAIRLFHLVKLLNDKLQRILRCNFIVGNIFIEETKHDTLSQICPFVCKYNQLSTGLQDLSV